MARVVCVVFVVVLSICTPSHMCNCVSYPQLVVHFDETDLSSKHSTTSTKAATHTAHSITPESTPAAVQQPVETPAGSHIELQLAVTFSDGVQLTEGAPSEWQILLDEGGYISVSDINRAFFKCEIVTFY